MLGWRILEYGEYRLDLPRLSEEEEAAIKRISEKFREVTRNESTASKEHGTLIIKKLLEEYCQENKIYLDRGQTEYLSKMAYLDLYGLAFIEQLLADEGIEEISIINVNKPAYVYLRNKGWKSVNACFTDTKALAEVVNKMARALGRHITVQNPRLDAMLSDGSRLHASMPPISNGELTIRKFREKPFSPNELCENATLNARALAYLSLLMQGDNSLLVAGNTASGKTTTLNALFSFVPANERIIITEETPEINIPHRHQLRLIANKEMGITLKSLVYDSLRMRPDRMIVGEIRNEEEAEALFDVLLAGQARGSYATMHAQSTDEVIQRLLSFGVSRMDINSIDCVIVQRRMLTYSMKKKQNVEIRRIVSISEIGEKTNTIFSYNSKTNKLEECMESRLLQGVANSFGAELAAVKEEMKRREKLFHGFAMDAPGFYNNVQKEFYGLKGTSHEEY